MHCNIEIKSFCFSQFLDGSGAAGELPPSYESLFCNTVNLNGSEEPPRYANLQQSATEQEGDENLDNIPPEPSAVVGGDVIEVDNAEQENVDQTADRDCCSCQVYSLT